MYKEVNVIIIAMQEEFSAFIDLLDVPYSIVNIEGERGISFKKNDEAYLALRGKVGKVSTAFFIGCLSREYHIKRIFNIGTSGAYNKDLNIGDIVIATKVIYHDVDVTKFSYEIGQVPGFPRMYECDISYIKEKKLNHEENFKIVYGLISSGDSFVTKDNVNNFYISELNPLAIEMESTTVGQCAYLLKIPFIVIRSISDCIFTNDENNYSDDNTLIASRNCAKVLISLL